METAFGLPAQMTNQFKNSLFLFDLLAKNDTFLANIICVSVETLPIVTHAKSQPAIIASSIKDLKSSWLEITSSKWFLFPGKNRHELKRLCLGVLIEIVNLNHSVTDETLDNLSTLLSKTIRNRTTFTQRSHSTYPACNF